MKTLQKGSDIMFPDAVLLQCLSAFCCVLGTLQIQKKNQALYHTEIIIIKGGNI